MYHHFTRGHLSRSTRENPRITEQRLKETFEEKKSSRRRKTERGEGRGRKRKKNVNCNCGTGKEGGEEEEREVDNWMAERNKGKKEKKEEKKRSEKRKQREKEGRRPRIPQGRGGYEARQASEKRMVIEARENRRKEEAGYMIRHGRETERERERERGRKDASTCTTTLTTTGRV